jgi:putative CocE/NonD family hydrolase
MKLIISLLLIICILYTNINDKSIQQDEFIELIKSKGAAAAIKYYKEFAEKNPGAILFKRETINNLGWQTAEKGNIDEAIRLFELNLLAYSNHYDPWDSYAEAILIRGGKDYIETAIRYFEKSLELNPENNNASQRISVLRNYKEYEYMIPMRDGVKLFTQVYVPNDSTKEYPILIKRDWYSIQNYGPEYRRILHRNELLVKEGFIFVFQDIRGRFMSEGDFKVLRPFIRNKISDRQTDESTDAFDTIEWLLQNIKGHNGKVGITGGSYSGWAALMAAIESHPAIKAISVAASPADWWLGDDIHHNGAFRLMYAYSWVGHDAWPRTNGPTSKSPSWPGYTHNDGYRFFLDLGPIRNVNKKYFKNKNPTWNEYMRHGDYDEYWKNLNILQYLHNIKVPVLNIIGWFDAEDYRGPLMIYKTIEKNNPDIFNSVVIGPWSHGAWHNSTGEKLGDINFGSKTSEFFQTEIEFPYFMHFLMDSEISDIPEVYAFQTGTNVWKKFDSWPPGNIKGKKLYLVDKGKLKFTPDYENDDLEYDEFISDPDNPVPWSEAKQTQQGHIWMISDQRFASKRQDVLVYQTEPLQEDLTIAGPIIARLSFSTTGTDADWIVKIIDVYPEDAKGIQGGYQMLLAGDVFRSKYRNSYEIPEPLVTNEITEIEFNLYDKFHTFKKGHRIMVQIQSTWFPVIDRNPQTFCNIYEAEEDDFQKSSHRIHHTVTNESFISLYIMTDD